MIEQKADPPGSMHSDGDKPSLQSTTMHKYRRVYFLKLKKIKIKYGILMWQSDLHIKSLGENRKKYAFISKMK